VKKSFKTTPKAHENTRQATSNVLMIRPVAFRYNAETAVNNHFQVNPESLSDEDANKKAQEEFDVFVEMLRKEGVSVYVFQDSSEPDTPDSIFANNWVSFHSDGRIAIYPVYAENRRTERREEIFEVLADDFGFDVVEIEDFTHFEGDGLFLEGTGSMVLDRINHLAYAAVSERTDIHVLETFCDHFNYEPIAFTANQTVNGNRVPIYHTNVTMSLAAKFSVICMNAIDDEQDKKAVRNALKETGKKIVEITEDQQEHFAGNVLAVTNDKGEELCVMSSAAYKSLRPDQVEAIEKHARIIHSSLDTIEAIGGGSVRCMMAEIFLQKSDSAND